MTLWLTLGVAAAFSLPSAAVVIPSWHIASTTDAGSDLSALSHVGIDTSSWHQTNSSKCTLMSCLIEAGVHDETELFYSNALESFDASTFQDPWLYRQEFELIIADGAHYFLHTNGISSKAEIFVNGHQIANSSYQSGSYVGHSYDITSVAAQNNAVLIQVHPNDYNYDLALGFVDWNPSPPDNGTGVWRDVEITQGGPISLRSMTVATELEIPVEESSAQVTLKAVMINLEDREISVDVTADFSAPYGGSNGSSGSPIKVNKTFTLGPSESRRIALSTTIEQPAIWWPAAWGDQPLYTGLLTARINGSVSDIAQKSFGIRKVTSEVNRFNDTMFSVNGYPFQVLGGGYSSSMFLTWNQTKFDDQMRYMLDLGHNTVRLEGKNEQPELYDRADVMGIMVMAGWECCDKWEAWTYNEDLSINDKWTSHDYETSRQSMLHEAMMQQNHPSMLAYLVGSDYWPDDRATKGYINALNEADWQMPVIASASKRGYPEALGPGGMKMEGPYDWVPPNYWYDVEPSDNRYGAAFGFGSEQGAGVGTPEIGSLKKFLSKKDMEDLWKHPNKGLYHMSTAASSFHNRKIYNDALWARLGSPSSLDDYLLKAQIMDYEATRAEFEGFSIKWSAEHPATGLIYWMLNNAWPSLHWNLFDYYQHPAGSYFGAKTGARQQHVAYDYINKDVWLINHSINETGSRCVAIDGIDVTGQSIFSKTTTLDTEPNASKRVADLAQDFESVSDVVFLRLVLKDSSSNAELSRNVYWVAPTIDTLNWKKSSWYSTPVTKYANFKALNDMDTATVSAELSENVGHKKTVILENKSSVPAFFIRMNLVNSKGEDVAPVFWSDNYVTLWPGEKMTLQVEGEGETVEISGMNIDRAIVRV